MRFQRCLRCNQLTDDHRRSMLAVTNSHVPPAAGFKKNLFDCIQSGGPKVPRGSGDQQLGEGGSSYPPDQMH